MPQIINQYDFTQVVRNRGEITAADDANTTLTEGVYTADGQTQNLPVTDPGILYVFRGNTFASNDVIQEYVTDNREIWLRAQIGGVFNVWRAQGSQYGVTTFNGRDGDVNPQTGDYAAIQIGLDSSGLTYFTAPDVQLGFEQIDSLFAAFQGNLRFRGLIGFNDPDPTPPAAGTFIDYYVFNTAGQRTVGDIAGTDVDIGDWLLWNEATGLWDYLPYYLRDIPADRVTFDNTNTVIITGDEVQTALEELDTALANAGIAKQVDTWATATNYAADTYLRGDVNGSPVFAWVVADYTSGASFEQDIVNGDLLLEDSVRLNDPTTQGNDQVINVGTLYEDGAGAPRDIVQDSEIVNKQYVDRQGWIKRNFSSAAGTWQAGDWITIITRETSSVSYQNYVHFVVHTSGTGSNRTQFSGIINVTQGTNQIILNDWFTYNGNAFDAIRFDRTPEVRIQLRAAQNQGGAVSWNIATFDPAPGATNPFVGVQPIVQAAGDGVDVISNLATGQSVASSRIREVTNPVDPQDAATKAYVDANSGGGTVSQGSAALADNATMNARQHVTCFNLNPPATLIGVSCIVDFTFVLDMGNNTGNSAGFWARCNTNSTGQLEQRITAAIANDSSSTPIATGAARFRITPTGGTIQVQLRSEASNNVFWRDSDTYGRGHCTIAQVTVV